MNEPEQDTPIAAEPNSPERKPSEEIGESPSCHEAEVSRLSRLSIVLIIIAIFAVLFGINAVGQAPSYVFDILVIALFFTILGYDQIQPKAMWKAIPRTFFPVIPSIGQEAGVPRQFGIGTLLIITAVYAVLFAVLRLLQTPSLVFVVITLFVTAIGLGQMLLFQGKRPQRASVVTGACFCLCLMVVNLVHDLSVLEMPTGGLVLLVFVGLAFWTFCGAGLGWVVGASIAALFWCMEQISPRRDTRKNHDDSAGPWAR